MQKYTRERAYEETLQYFGGDELATTVWINKYALKDSEGNLYESNPSQMHRRIADELARVDSKYPNPLSSDFYFSLLDRFKYVVPQGSPMAGIGNNLQIVSLSNCYVIGNSGSSDSYGGIMKTDQEQVQLMKRRAGVGHDLSHIRPKGSAVKNSALTSTGVVPFMERYSNSTREVAQDGRRGALMLSIDITHPDVMDFINAKLELGKVTGANISVKIYDDWMEIVDRTTDEEVAEYKSLLGRVDELSELEKNRLSELKSKIVYVHKFYYPNGEVFEREAIAKELFDVLVYNAWKSAEPGALFWTQMLKESIGECYSEYGFANVSTNPCMVGDTKVFTNKGWVSFKLLTEWFNQKIDVKILTTDKDKNLSYSEMEFCGVTNKNDDIYKITFTNGKYLLVNNKHKLYDTEYNQRLCIDLKSGDVIRGYLDDTLIVDEVVPMGYKEDVYDLTVRPNLNFFALYDMEEVYFEDKVIINDDISYYVYDLVLTDKGLKYAVDLEEGDEIL